MNAHAKPQDCELALDADEILTALDEGLDGLATQEAVEHLDRCASCRHVVELRRRARSAWTAMKGVPAPDATEHSELRRIWEGRSTAVRAARPLPARAVVTFAAATPFALAAIVIAFILRPTASVSERHEPSLPLAASAAPPSGVAAAASAIATPPPPPAAKPTRSMSVPSGSHVMLGFAIGIGAVDPDGSAELVGPASATATDTSLTVQRGMVRMRGLRNVTVIVPGARVEPNGSTCTVNVDDAGVARLDVQAGRAMIVGRNGGVVTVESGGTMQLDPDGSFRVPQPAPSAVPAKAASEEEPVRKGTLSATPAAAAGSDMREALTTPIPSKPSTAVAVSSGGGTAGQLPGSPDEALSAARTRMRNGEAAAARADLEKLAASTDARVARRASFTLAEMDLAAGDHGRARTRLDALVVCPEPALGADAATLLARTLAAPERAAMWKRYLTTNPPRPYFERALLDRAEALLDSGRGAEARAFLDEAKNSPSLTEPQRRQLDRLFLKARELR